MIKYECQDASGEHLQVDECGHKISFTVVVPDRDDDDETEEHTIILDHHQARARVAQLLSYVAPSMVTDESH